MKRSLKKVLTHNGRFHADDVFAIAVLKLYYKDIEVIRTRELSLINGADIVIDVGSAYNPHEFKFDHHQRSYKELRSNGIPYASFGLVWAHFGKKLCGTFDVAEYIDKRLVQFIDAEDNGVELYDSNSLYINNCTISEIIDSFVPRYTTEKSKVDDSFNNALEFATSYLKREIENAIEIHRMALPIIKDAIEKSQDSKIIILDKFDKTWLSFISLLSDDILFVIFQTHRETWGIRTIPKKGKKFEARKLLPSEWAGIDNELPVVTGIKDALYCHKGRFLAEVKTLEGALALVSIACKN